ncbi:MAG: hypothetical protein K8S27_14530 [Candidatus Omnitrophica bacterium]|nr:hypothetical protein [Candidatus Omnitrophota bacterium]
MKCIFQCWIVVISGITLSGCYTTGLSIRETGAMNLTNYVYSMYDGKSDTRQKTHYIKKPIKLAVAQVGEVAPQNTVIEKLSQQRQLIYSVTTVPSGEVTSHSQSNGGNGPDRSEVAVVMKKMCYLANDQGADYLFIFGGSTDFKTTPNFLQFFDITLIGAYIIPGTQHDAEGRASGALIDVRSGKVVFMANASASVSKRTPSYLNYDDRNNAVFMELRNALVDKLSDDFIDKLSTFNR